MKLFVVSYEHGDTCGNTWAESKDPVLYFRAANIKRVWERLGKPRVTQYTMKNGKEVSFLRTPKGKGYGQWEDNPDFDFQRELTVDNLKTIETGGFFSTIVRELKFETI